MPPIHAALPARLLRTTITIGAIVSALAAACAAPGQPPFTTALGVSAAEPSGPTRAIESATSHVEVGTMPPPQQLALSPAFTSIALHGATTFAARAAGAGFGDETVAWSIVERSDETGGATIDDRGAFVAGSASGVFHVVATSKAAPSKRATATVLVGSVAPQLQRHGGSVLASPVIVPILFADDPFADDLQAFVSRIGTSDAWRAMTSEYGVGDARVAPAIRLPEASPELIDDVAVRARVASAVLERTLAMGPPAGDPLYVVWYPHETTITYGSFSSCSMFGGYHGAIDVPGGGRLAYAVIARCRNDLGWTTQLTTHELVEAVTDPGGGDAWAGVDADHAIWGVLLRAESGDLCEWGNVSSDTNPIIPGLGRIQRSWSNASARAGHDPCVPAPAGEAYFTAIPVMRDHVTIRAGGDRYATLGVHVPVGAARTIPVDLVADAPRGGWTLKATDLGRGTLDFAFDDETGAAGDRRSLTITVRAQDDDFGGEPFAIVSSDGSAAHVFYGFVGN